MSFDNSSSPVAESSAAGAAASAPSQPPAGPTLHHNALETTFHGVPIAPSASDAARVHQYFGIKYATLDARFRQSRICTTYPPNTDASAHGPICPQPSRGRRTEELLYGIPKEDIPEQQLKHNEFHCLNLNITCPAGLSRYSRIPVMVWIHGGGDRGSGSDWMYDGFKFVLKSIEHEKPVIMVSINFRIGLLGFAASPALREDNKAAGDEGVGNYGLRDQRVAMEWIHRYIGEFGGDPNNVTLFGSGSGAADIVCHLLSRDNATRPLFHRAIVQSAVFEPILPDVGNAGWQLNRIMSALQVNSVDKFRNADVQKLLGLGQNIRAVDDGVWFREGWQSYFSPETAHAHSHHKDQLRSTARSRLETALHPSASTTATSSTGLSGSRSRSRSAVRRLASRSRSRPPGAILDHPYVPGPVLQPLIIGDNSCDSLLWSVPISLWTAAGVVRRLKAICQSLSKTNNLMRYYDLSTSTPDHEVIDHVLELVNDARVAWPTELLVENARHERGDRDVWRYVFDQEGPVRGMPHHAADLMYLFDNCPLPEHITNPPTPATSPGEEGDDDPNMDGMYYDLSEEEDEPVKFEPVTFRSRRGSTSFCLPTSLTEEETQQHLASLTSSLADSTSNSNPTASTSALGSGSGSDSEDDWGVTIVDDYAYHKVRCAIQERWLSFAYGEDPWKDDKKVFVFGPEAEAGERRNAIFEGRRRKAVWKEVFEPLGSTVVQKLGVELSRGPGN